MSRTVSRTTCWKSTYVVVEISPSTTTSPVVVAVSHATRAFGSSRMIASRIASDTWSHILSGCPSVTDSEVNRYCAASTMLVMQVLCECRRRGYHGACRWPACVRAHVPRRVAHGIEHWLRMRMDAYFGGS